MKVGNFAFELAELRATQERDAGVALAQSALKQPGRSSCLSCGDEIEAERRQALPSAERCVVCQARLERWRKGRR